MGRWTQGVELEPLGRKNDLRWCTDRKAKGRVDERSSRGSLGPSDGPEIRGIGIHDTPEGRPDLWVRYRTRPVPVRGHRFDKDGEKVADSDSEECAVYYGR